MPAGFNETQHISGESDLFHMTLDFMKSFEILFQRNAISYVFQDYFTLSIHIWLCTGLSMMVLKKRNSLERS